ncbi:MAG: small multi-drug export protein [bacterium]|nr:small multi-drug export protein [bacterium]
MDGIIQTFLLAMLPIGELRVSLPISIAVYNLDWKLAFLISILGNLVPVLLLLLFLGPVSTFLSNNCVVFKTFFDWLFERTRKKTDSQLLKYGSIALVFFVAIPLPLTGAWTGAIAAFLFGFSFRKAFPLISLGVVIAGVIVLILTKLGLWLI